jgi:hypothetical protein
LANQTLERQTPLSFLAQGPGQGLPRQTAACPYRGRSASAGTPSRTLGCRLQGRRHRGESAGLSLTLSLPRRPARKAHRRLRGWPSHLPLPRQQNRQIPLSHRDGGTLPGAATAPRPTQRLSAGAKLRLSAPQLQATDRLAANPATGQTANTHCTCTTSTDHLPVLRAADGHRPNRCHPVRSLAFKTDANTPSRTAGYVTRRCETAHRIAASTSGWTRSTEKTNSPPNMTQTLTVSTVCRLLCQLGYVLPRRSLDPAS